MEKTIAQAEAERERRSQIKTYILAIIGIFFITIGITLTLLSKEDKYFEEDLLGKYAGLTTLFFGFAVFSSAAWEDAFSKICCIVSAIIFLYNAAYLVILLTQLG
jgi:hypothetical protein